MKQSIGHIPIYVIVALFLVITFGFLAATLTYMKAFKVNGRIAKALENFEGYNSLSNAEIKNVLGTLGYRIGTPSQDECKKHGRNGNGAIIETDGYYYCLYELPFYSNGKNKSRYFNYGIVTYIFMDIPIVGGTFKVPVYSETEKIFKFSA